MKFLLDMPDSEMCGLLARACCKKVPPETIEKSICVVDRKRIRVTRLPFGRKA